MSPIAGDPDERSDSYTRPQPLEQAANAANAMVYFSKQIAKFMKTCFSAVTGYLGARSNFLGRLVCMALVFGSTISLSFAEFQDGGVHGLRGSFVGPVQRIGFTAPHDSDAVYKPYLSRHRGGTTGYPEYRGPLVAPNRDKLGSRNGSFPSPASQIGTIRRREAAPQTRDLNPPAADRSAAPQGPQRDSAEINTERSEIGSQHLSADPGASEERARVNEKFQRYEDKFASDPLISGDRPERLNRARVFLLNLIDLGYASLIVDNWSDDLLDDQIVDGMPMDLVDAYWGQPVDTQELVE